MRRKTANPNTHVMPVIGILSLKWHSVKSNKFQLNVSAYKERKEEKLAKHRILNCAFNLLCEINLLLPHALTNRTKYSHGQQQFNVTDIDKLSGIKFVTQIVFKKILQPFCNYKCKRTHVTYQ